MSAFISRILRAAKLDAGLYKEVEADRNATGQAFMVVVLSSLATAAGGAAASGMDMLVGILLSLASWCFWAYLIYFIGAKLFPEPQTKSAPAELLRTIGFASSPGILRIFGFMPLTRGLVFLVTTIWMLIAMVLAVKQTLDYKSTLRSIGVCLIGLILQTLLFLSINSLLSGIWNSPT